MEGVTLEMEKQIKKRKKAFLGQTDGEIWGDIYRVLFPGEDVPTPTYDYVQDNVAQAFCHNLTREDFVYQEVPRIFGERVKAYITGLGIGEDKVAAAHVREDYVARMTEIVKECQTEARSKYDVNKLTLLSTQEQEPEFLVEAMPPLITRAKTSETTDTTLLAGPPSESLNPFTLHESGPIPGGQYNIHGEDLMDEVNSSYHSGYGNENLGTVQENARPFQRQMIFNDDASSFVNMDNIEQEGTTLAPQHQHQVWEKVF